MVHSTLRALAVATAGLCALAASAAVATGPVEIEYELTPLAAGRYEYRYTVSNLSLATPVSWFSIDFDTALFDEASLAIKSVGVGDWSETLLFSVPIFGVPAQYDAYKTIGAGLAVGESEAGFAVEFTWLGAGQPGAQAFTIYDPATANIVLAGATTNAVGVPPPGGIPEPSTAALALAAFGGLVAVRRRHSQRSTSAA